MPTTEQYIRDLESRLAGMDDRLGRLERTSRIVAGGVGRVGAAQSIPDATVTAVQFDTVRFDTAGGMFDLSTANTVATIRIPGTYLIVGTMQFQANATGDRTVWLRVNGTLAIAKTQAPNAGGASALNMPPVARIYPLAAGDTVQMLAQQGSGVALNANVVDRWAPELTLARLG